MKNPDKKPTSIDNLNETSGRMVCIIGGGLSGLLSAIHLAEKNENVNIVIVEKPQHESNTQISGMRFRERIAGSKAKPEERADDIVRLLRGINKDIETPQMSEFAQVLVEELDLWNERLNNLNGGLVTNEEAWFGPQWGIPNDSKKGGRGYSILKALREIALSKSNIHVINGEVTALRKDVAGISGLEVATETGNFLIRPDFTVLANGSATGELFDSTNKPIEHSAVSLLYEAGLPLTGATLNMWHPFGRLKKDGTPTLGCMETDELSDMRIRYSDGTTDNEVNGWLRNHQAHYHFREITERMLKMGGSVELIDTEDKTIRAGVSLHYNHLGALTTNGVQVEGVSNLFAVGDAASITFFTEGNTRLPGFALSNCLVTARLATDNISAALTNQKNTEGIQRVTSIEATLISPRPDNHSRKILRETNTRYFKELEFSTTRGAEEVLHEWESKIGDLNHPLIELTLGIIDASRRVYLMGEGEPVRIQREYTPTRLEGHVAEDTHDHTRARRL